MSASHNPGGPENDWGIKVFSITHCGEAFESITSGLWELFANVNTTIHHRHCFNQLTEHSINQTQLVVPTQR